MRALSLPDARDAPGAWLMASRRRYLALAGIALAVLLGVAAAIALFVQDPERYRAQIAAALSAAAGQPVALGGALSLSWRPSPTLSAYDVSLTAAGARVTMQRVQVVVEPQALLARTLRARRVVVEGLRVDLDAAPAAGQAPVAMPDFAALAVEELQLHGVTVLRAGTPWFALASVTVREAGNAAGARIDLAAPIDGRELRARGRIRTAPDRLDLDELQVHLPVGVVSGHLQLALDGARAQLSGALDADALVLGARSGVDLRALHALALDLAPLAGVDASLRVRIGRLSLSRFMISEITAPVSLRAGLLEVKAAGVLAAGPLRATLQAGAPDGRFTLDLGLAAADAGSVLVMAGLTTAERGGRLALEASVHGAGSDAAALLANLHGRLAIDASAVTVRAGTARLAGSDVVGSLLRALQPGASNRVVVGCAVAHFEVRDGVLIANDSIGMQSRTTNLLGSGRIALHGQRLDLVLRPWPREGSAAAAAAGGGALAISGPVADPQVSIANEAQVRSGDGDGALLAGALLPIARGLLARAHGDAPCEQAARGAPSPRAATAESGGTAPDGGGWPVLARWGR